jgi:hypothetical protein
VKDKCQRAFGSMIYYLNVMVWGLRRTMQGVWVGCLEVMQIGENLFKLQAKYLTINLRFKGNAILELKLF